MAFGFEEKHVLIVRLSLDVMAINKRVHHTKCIHGYSPGWENMAEQTN